MEKTYWRGVRRGLKQRGGKGSGGKVGRGRGRKNAGLRKGLNPNGQV